MDLLEAHNRGLFDSVHRYVRDGAKFDKLAVHVLANLLANGHLRSWVLRCLDGQVLDVD